MSSRVRPLLALIVVVSGLVTALLVGLVIGRLIPSKRPPAALTMVGEQALDSSSPRSDILRRRSPLRPAAIGPAPGDPAVGAANPEEARRQLQGKLQRALQEHAREAIDGRWAATTNSLLEQDLRPLAEGLGFSLGRVDCRTTRCTVDVSWQTREAAVETYRRLLWQPVRANCARFILIPDGEPGAKTSTKLMLNCEAWREGGAVVMEGLPAVPVR